MNRRDKNILLSNAFTIVGNIVLLNVFASGTSHSGLSIAPWSDASILWTQYLLAAVILIYLHRYPVNIKGFGNYVAYYMSSCLLIVGILFIFGISGSIFYGLLIPAPVVFIIILLAKLEKNNEQR